MTKIQKSGYYYVMEIGSYSNSYSNMFQDIASYQSKEIKQAAVMEELSLKVTIASITADSICNSLFEPDSVIPEDSTISFHV